MILMIGPSLASQGKTNDPKYSGITRKIRRKETSHNKILAWNDVKQWNRARSKTGIVSESMTSLTWDLIANIVIIKEGLVVRLTSANCFF